MTTDMLNAAGWLRAHELYSSEDMREEVARLDREITYRLANYKDVHAQRTRKATLVVILMMREHAGDGPCDDVTHWIGKEL